MRDALVTNELQDLFLYSGKHRPDLYLDPAVRDNISSFANLAPVSELQDGLALLASDIQTGTVTSVITKSALQNPWNPHECLRIGVNAVRRFPQKALSEEYFSGGNGHADT